MDTCSVGILRFGNPFFLKRATGFTRSEVRNLFRSWHGFKAEACYLPRILSGSLESAISKIVGDLLVTIT